MPSSTSRWIGGIGVRPGPERRHQRGQAGHGIRGDQPTCDEPADHRAGAPLQQARPPARGLAGPAAPGRTRSGACDRGTPSIRLGPPGPRRSAIVSRPGHAGAPRPGRAAPAGSARSDSWLPPPSGPRPSARAGSGSPPKVPPSSTASRTPQARTCGTGAAEQRQAGPSHPGRRWRRGPRSPGAGGGRPRSVARISRRTRCAAGQVLAGGGPLLEQSTRRADVPFIGVELELRQLLVGLRGQVDLHRPDVAVGDLEDPAVLAVRAVGVVLVAFADVGPVGEVDAAVGAVFQLEARGTRGPTTGGNPG